MAEQAKQRTMEETPTWAVAVVCFVLIVISIFIEHIIHLIGKWLTKKHKPALYEALEKVKAELMLLGFISLLLTVLQSPISEICISRSIGETWLPCSSEEIQKKEAKGGRRLLQFLGTESSPRRILAAKGYDSCDKEGKVAFMSAYAIHQLHIFIFVLAAFHILYCIATLALGRTKLTRIYKVKQAHRPSPRVGSWAMRKWKGWEDETKTIEYQYYNDPARFRFARDTTFGRRHLSTWSRTTVSIWIVCFFRQFLRSVTKVDYLTLRHGFIMAHLAPGSETKFDFQNYINKSLEEDFKVVVGIGPAMWLCAVLFLITNAYGWHSYLWLPFISLIVVLLVGTKLQVIITKLGVRIQERGDVVKGAPVVKPGDDLFWFGRPKFMLFLINFVLFQNAFQLAFFVWSTLTFTLRSCFHKNTEDIVIRVSLGVVIQVLCSYVTLPLYALVTQMGSNMRPTIFNDRVAAALKNWHHSAKKNTRHHRHPDSNTPLSSRPGTPSHGMSPMHLLHNYNQSSTSPRLSVDNEQWHTEEEDSSLPHHRVATDDSEHDPAVGIIEIERPMQEFNSTVPSAPRPHPTQHEIDMSSSDFSFAK